MDYWNGYDQQYKYADWNKNIRVEKTDCRNKVNSRYEHRIWIHDPDTAYEFMIWAHNTLGPGILKEVYLDSKKLRDWRVDRPAWLIDNKRDTYFYIRNDLMPIVILGWKE